MRFNNWNRCVIVGGCGNLAGSETWVDVLHGDVVAFLGPAHEVLWKNFIVCGRELGSNLVCCGRVPVPVSGAQGHYRVACVFVDH